MGDEECSRALASTQNTTYAPHDKRLTPGPHTVNHKFNLSLPKPHTSNTTPHAPNPTMHTPRSKSKASTRHPQPGSTPCTSNPNPQNAHGTQLIYGYSVPPYDAAYRSTLRTTRTRHFRVRRRVQVFSTSLHIGRAQFKRQDAPVRIWDAPPEVTF